MTETTKLSTYEFQGCRGRIFYDKEEIKKKIEEENDLMLKQDWNPEQLLAITKTFMNIQSALRIEEEKK